MSTELSKDVAHRLRTVAKRIGGLDALAVLTETPRRTLGNYLAGRNEPKLAFLAAVSSKTGTSLDWLVSGDEPKTGAQTAAQAIDEELMGRVADAVSRLYRDERVHLAPIDLGRISGRKYSEICSATDDPAERLAMIKLVVTQLRADIRAAAAEPGTGKASA